MSAVSHDPSICQGFLYRILDSNKAEVGHLAGTFRFQNEDPPLGEAMKEAIQKSKIVYLQTSPSISLLPKLNEHTVDNKVSEYAKQLEKESKNLQDIGSQGTSWLEAVLGKVSETEMTELFQYFVKLDRDPDSDLAVSYLQALAYRYGEEALSQHLVSSRPHPQLKTQYWMHNPLLAEKIHASLEKGENPFVAIDMGHLWGLERENGEKECGVIDLLKEKGWSIERVGSSVPNELFEYAIANFLAAFETSEPPRCNDPGAVIEHIGFWQARTLSLTER